MDPSNTTFNARLTSPTTNNWHGGYGAGPYHDGFDFAATPTAATTVLSNEEEVVHNFDVMADVIAWHSGVSNYGWLLRNDRDVITTYQNIWWGSEGAAVASRPQLELGFYIPTHGTTFMMQ